MRVRSGAYLAGVFCLLISPAAAQTIGLFNADFELDAAVTSPPTGWTASAGTLYVTSGSGLSPVDPTSAYSGTRFLTANRLAPNPDASFPSAQTMSIFQTVDVSSFASEIDAGNRFAQLSFAYNDADADDNGIVSMRFLDGSATPLGTDAVFETGAQPTGSGEWSTASLLGAVPTGTRSIQFSLLGERISGSGSARNVNYDALAAQLLDGPPPAPARDVAHANLIQFTENGAWSWFQDERAIVDTERNKLVVGSIANGAGVGAQAADGHVQTTIFDLTTASRTTFVHKDLESYGGGDDHNLPALLKLPDGDYLAMYAAHNHISNNGPYPNDGGSRIENYRSYNRIYDVETETWGPEQEYDWAAVIPSNAPGSGGTTYSNLFLLSAENNGQGRVYNIARTQQSPHIMYSDDGGATWIYGGQLTKQASNPPSNSYVNGYYKFVSNGVDRIDMIATEFHPRDFNTSIYHAYIQGGKLYDSAGNEIDGDIFDAASSFNANNVTSTDDFAQVFQAGTASNSRAWTTDVQSYEDGSISALFKARAGGYNSHTVGADDHRIWFARFDPGTKQWTATEIAKAGAQLFGGSETDYTGLGALHPNDPNTVYISTEIDPITDANLPHHEIFKGVTSDHGLHWEWTAITEHSSYDNLRPIIPHWDADNTAVLWWRGSMSSSQNFDTAVVGILDQKDKRLGHVHYLDATVGNTTLADGSALMVSGPSNSDGSADGLWHQRTGAGNGSTVLAADDSGAEDAPTIKTSLGGLDAGAYDVFAFFWSDVNQDWQIEAGLDPSDMTLFRTRGSQQAEAEQFDGAPVLDAGNISLYRAYLGRIDVTAAQTIDVFVNDSVGGSPQRVWYDGFGYARVLPINLVGDYNEDGTVDAADYVVWRIHFGTNDDLPNDPIGGTIGQEQYDQWKNHFGTTDGAGSNNAASDTPVPEPASVLIITSGFLPMLSRRLVAK